jgi:uncharacterized damage-inducible protein DinB
VKQTILGAWRTNCRVTASFIAGLPSELWASEVPGTRRKTIRMLAAHLHNSRARWIRTLGKPHGIRMPALVNPRRVTRKQLLAALSQSAKQMEALLDSGIAAGGELKASKAYVWRNLALDVGHVLTYFVAHEAHHRGQLVMLARQLGHRLPSKVTADLWWWKERPGKRTARS